MEENTPALFTEFMNSVRNGEKDEQIAHAKRLFISPHHKKALIAFEIIEKQHPEEAAYALFKQGECYLKMDREDKAIECFEMAKEKFYDASLVDEAIWSATQTAFAKYRDIEIVEQFIKKYPHSESLRYAQSILENR
ncbi:MAG: tetratricopeptide repeat protein [Bacteroidales bacterium]|jgi:tetratricopeptide (TPR) repeat protein|nr:tetratricopeptide repeat protein [Bacteroidales bacterium]